MTASAPDPELRAAAALVFVEDLGSPWLCAQDGHHLGEVLRLQAGEAVAAADGAGSWRMCTFTVASAMRRSSGRASKETGFGLEGAGPVRHLERALPELEIGFSWAKAERTEWAVAKLVELGVDTLTPLVADRTVVRPDREGTARREARLRRIVREAAMQARRPLLPSLGSSVSLDAVLERLPGPEVALAEPGGGPVSLASPVVLVGPEGGWTPRELALVETKVSLGNGVLRVETAAVAAGVILSALRNMAVAPVS
ncbi:MAG: RsmE family RNA methyltransferase [Acidimicrobiales bacterium]